MELPVIDIGPGQFSDEQNERDEGGQKQQEEEHILREIRAACETTGPGFFYLKMTAEEEMLADEALKMSRKFFKLPMSTKRRLDNDKDTFYKVDGIAVPGSGPGYRAPNLDPNFLKDARETYQVGRDDIPETHGKTPFPPEEDLPHFKDVCTRYMAALMKKSEKLRRAIAVSIGKPQDYFEKYFERGTFLLGMNRYWRRRSNPETGEYGIAPHEDDGVFTLLHTDGQPGLEIAPDWKGDGRMRSHSMHDLELRWEPISHKKGYWIVNLGTHLTLWTGGRYRSTLHRVMNDGEVDERFSLPFFVEANIDAPIRFRGEGGADEVTTPGEILLRLAREANLNLIRVN